MSLNKDELIEIRKKLDLSGELDLVAITFALNSLLKSKIRLVDVKETKIGFILKKISVRKDLPEISGLAEQIIQQWKTLISQKNKSASSSSPKKTSSSSSLSLSSDSEIPLDIKSPSPKPSDSFSLKFNTGSDIRNNVALRIKQSLFDHGIEGQTEEAAHRLSESIESEMIKTFKETNISYKSKALSLKSNLKGNMELCEELFRSEVSPRELLSYSEEKLASSKVRDQYDMLRKQGAAERSGEGKPLRASRKGLFVCPRCRCDETYIVQMQTRSADEPMTNFVTCAKCEFHFRR